MGTGARLPLFAGDGERNIGHLDPAGLQDRNRLLRRAARQREDRRFLTLRCVVRRLGICGQSGLVPRVRFVERPGWCTPATFNAIFFRDLLFLDHYAPDPAYRRALNAYLSRVLTSRNVETGLFDQDGIGSYGKAGN